MFDFLLKVQAKYLVNSDFKTVEKKFLDQGIEKPLVKDYLDRFKKLRDRNKLKDSEKNIDLWGKKTFKEFQERVEDLEKTMTSTEKRKGKVDLRAHVPGAKLIKENDDWVIYKIRTNKGSSTLAQGTKWCIRHNPSDNWEDYSSLYNIYFFISKNRKIENRWSKIALLVNSKGREQYWDVHNKAYNEIPGDLNIPKFIVESPNSIDPVKEYKGFGIELYEGAEDFEPEFIIRDPYEGKYLGEILNAGQPPCYSIQEARDLIDHYIEHENFENWEW